MCFPDVFKVILTFDTEYDPSDNLNFSMLELII